MKQQILQESGIELVWRRRDLPPAAAAGAAADSAPAADGVSPTSQAAALATISAEIAACRACALAAKRRQAVPGVGDPDADWLFIGEGPGAEEDQRGEPFVGEAGKLLDAMLAAIGLRRGAGVYIANAVKCRPPNNRTPQPEEIDACRGFLQRQIAVIRPRLLVLLGASAVKAVLAEELPIGASRGKVFTYRDTGAGIELPVLITYHPSYLLRQPGEKAKAWQDLCQARRLLAELRAAAA